MASSSSTTITANELVEQSITTMKSGDKVRAAELLAQAIQLDPNHEHAWLWLSGIVTSDAERRFCLERVRAINPQNAAAQHGLSLLPADIAPQPPTLRGQNGQQKQTCTFPGCNKPITRAGHTLCYDHWKAVNRPPAITAPGNTQTASNPALIRPNQ
jgi:hypothetical protein